MTANTDTDRNEALAEDPELAALVHTGPLPARRPAPAPAAPLPDLDDVDLDDLLG